MASPSPSPPSLPSDDHVLLFTIDADWVPGSAAGLESVLHLCRTAGVRSTIFTTGKFALAHADLIRAADAAGHEIGCHGWQHPMPVQMYENYRLSPVPLRREWLVRATDAIGSVLGRLPTAFRAPFLWVDSATFRLLEELGYSVDSSIPSRRFDGLIGVVNYREYFWGRLEPYLLDLDRPVRRGTSSILEIPPSALLLPMNMSTIRFAGLSAALFLAGLLSMRSRIMNFYCHPWEFVPTSAMEVPADGPARHLGTTGPHLLRPLAQFVDRIIARGYRSATLREVAACTW